MSLINMPKYISIELILKILSMRVAVLSVIRVDFVIVGNKELEIAEIPDHFHNFINLY